MGRDLEMLDNDCIAAAMQHLREVHGITYLPIVSVVYGMASTPGRGYHKVLWDWTVFDHKIAGFPKADIWWWHSEICRYLLKSGADVSGGTEQWFENRAKEVRVIAHRVSSRKGS